MKTVWHSVFAGFAAREPEGREAKPVTSKSGAAAFLTHRSGMYAAFLPYSCLKHLVAWQVCLFAVVNFVQ